jgi:hypothetical protein
MALIPKPPPFARLTMTERIPKAWSPVASQTIETLFERSFRVINGIIESISDEIGLVVGNGITALNPSVGDLITSVLAGQFSLLPINTTVQRLLTNNGGLPSWAQVATDGILDDAVTYAKMQNVSAASRLLGRGSAAGAGNVEEITLGIGLTMVGTELQSGDAAGFWTILTDGDPTQPELIFADGDVISMFVPA